MISSHLSWCLRKNHIFQCTVDKQEMHWWSKSTKQSLLLIWDFIYQDMIERLNWTDWWSLWMPLIFFTSQYKIRELYKFIAKRDDLKLGDKVVQPFHFKDQETGPASQLVNDRAWASPASSKLSCNKCRALPAWFFLLPLYFLRTHPSKRIVLIVKWKEINSFHSACLLL